MGWFGKQKTYVKEIEHVRGSKISSDRPSKNQKKPRWYDPADATTHDLPIRLENWTGGEAQTLSCCLAFEDIELDPEVPTKHLVIAGGTGSGKTQAIHRLLDRVLWGVAENKEKAIITDSGGQFFSRRSRQNDLLLNPFDGRSVQWNPFLEIEDQWDYDSLAESLFPLKEGHHGQEDEWMKKARGLIASIMKGLVREGNPDPKRVIEIIQPGDPELLRPYIVGTPEEALLMPMNERFLGSVIGEASLVLRPWSMLPRDGTFSLRKWVREGAPGSLFISYKDSQMSLLSPLIGGWMGIVVKEVLDLPPISTAEYGLSRTNWIAWDKSHTSRMQIPGDGSLACACRGRSKALPNLNRLMEFWEHRPFFRLFPARSFSGKEASRTQNTGVTNSDSGKSSKNRKLSLNLPSPPPKLKKLSRPSCHRNFPDSRTWWRIAASLEWKISIELNLKFGNTSPSDQRSCHLENPNRSRNRNFRIRRWQNRRRKRRQKKTRFICPSFQLSGWWRWVWPGGSLSHR